jgi:hypothetical protein
MEPADRAEFLESLGVKDGNCGLKVSVGLKMFVIC